MGIWVYSFPMKPPYWCCLLVQCFRFGPVLYTDLELRHPCGSAPLTQPSCRTVSPEHCHLPPQVTPITCRDGGTLWQKVTNYPSSPPVRLSFRGRLFFSFCLLLVPPTPMLSSCIPEGRLVWACRFLPLPGAQKLGPPSALDGHFHLY